MKGKTALVAIIIVVAIAAAALVSQNQSQNKLRQENADLRQQIDQLSALQAENERLSNQVAQLAAPQLAPDQMRELVKLRNEVATLRTQKSQLQGQSGELEKLREENQQLRERPAQAAAPGVPVPPQIDPEVAKNTCINNLRLIDAAKQQCAAANNLKITETVTPEQLVPYGVNFNALRCPAGGAYTIGPIGYKPTCSIPGHVLP